jgi:glycosyltransferase involved in cell wall biosynthesis
MKILIVASDFPWPSVQGGHLRLATAIRALAGLGEADLFALSDDPEQVSTLPPSIVLHRLKTVRRPRASLERHWRRDWLSRRGIPLEVIMQRSDATPRLELEAWAAGRYDLVWFERALTFELMGRPHMGPTVVDLIDLEDVKARLRARVLWNTVSRHDLAASCRTTAAALQALVNAGDWRRFQGSVAHDVGRVLLSSEQDLGRSGLDNAVVVPNTYEIPPRPVGRVEVGDPPTLLFQASFDYAPNADAAGWLVSEIAPLIRARIPDLRIRLVGRPVPGVSRLDGRPMVTVVGEVPDMQSELARADLVVAPIRYGSGTRLKILESFAHRVPVVSTTIGAEGLDVENGVHLLIGDEPATFSSACEQLLKQLDLRKRLVAAAESRYLERYEGSVARRHIEALVQEVTAEGRAKRTR